MITLQFSFLLILPIISSFEIGKMKILQFTQKVMKISTMLPFRNAQVIEVLKLAIFIIPPIYLTATSMIFIVVNIDNFSLVAQPVYVCVGSTIAISLSISFYLQTKRVAVLLKNIEVLVNRS